MTKWEYNWVNRGTMQQAPEWHDTLQKMGEDGWELVTVVSVQSDVIGPMAYFKRPKSS